MFFENLVDEQGPLWKNLQIVEGGGGGQNTQIDGTSVVTSNTTNSHV